MENECGSIMGHDSRIVNTADKAEIMAEKNARDPLLSLPPQHFRTCEFLERYNTLPREYVKRMISSNQKAIDQVYGVRYDTKTDTWLFGDSILIIEDKNFRINGVLYDGTPGLYELLVMKNPNRRLVTDGDERNYAEILRVTNVAHRTYDASKQLKGTRSNKYVYIIKPLLTTNTSTAAAAAATVKPIKSSPAVVAAAAATAVSDEIVRGEEDAAFKQLNRALWAPADYKHCGEDAHKQLEESDAEDQRDYRHWGDDTRKHLEEPGDDDARDYGGVHDPLEDSATGSTDYRQWDEAQDHLGEEDQEEQSASGSTDYSYYDDYDVHHLMEELQFLWSEKAAGYRGHDGAIASILEELLERGHIKKLPPAFLYSSNPQQVAWPDRRGFNRFNCNW